MRTWYSEDQEAIDSAFGAFFEAESPLSRVRSSARLGFDPDLWAELAGIGGPGMALAEAHGGADATLMDLAVVIRQMGRHLAPAPLIEHAVASRLLADVSGAVPDSGSRLGLSLPRLLTDLASGERIATLTLRPVASPPPFAGVPAASDPSAGTRPAAPDPPAQWTAPVAPDPSAGTRPAALDSSASRWARLVPAGAVASAVVGFDGADLVLDLSEPPGAAAPNTADLPLADRDLTAAAVIASGQPAARRWARARAEWQALMAVACCGLAGRALEIGVAYVMQRHQFGVPIGSFQAVQHGLAEASVRCEGARLLAHRAVWAASSGQPDGPRLAAMALLFCAEASRFTTDRVLQYHGGYGYSEEFDVQLYYRRAAGWPLQLGQPADLVSELADRELGPRQRK